MQVRLTVLALLLVGRAFGQQLNMTAVASSGCPPVVTGGGGPSGPNITAGPTVVTNSDQGATVSWTTDVASDSTVLFGATTSYGSSTNASAQVTSHVVSVTNLSSAALSHLAAASTNANGGKQSADLPVFTPSPASLTNGLAGYWGFDNVLTDAVGGNNFSPNGTFRYAPAYRYQGVDSTGNGYGLCADNPRISLQTDQSFSVSIWVYWASGFSSLQCICSKGPYSASGTWLLDTADTSGSAFRFGMGNGSTIIEKRSSGAGFIPAAGKWFNLIGVYDKPNKQIWIYVNGQQFGPTAFTTGTLYANSAMSVGGNNTGSYTPSATEDEMALWTNHALSASEALLVYNNGLLNKSPMQYAVPGNFRNTLYFNGDARFGNSGSTNRIPDYIQGSIASVQWALPMAGGCWGSNKWATIVNNSSGNPPPSPPNMEQLDDWTNNQTAWINSIKAYSGPGTNLLYIPQNGINDIFIMGGAPLSNYWTHTTIALQFTNWLNQVTTNIPGIKIISTTIIPQLGLELDAGDGTGMQQEQVRAFVNQVITNDFAARFGGINADPWSPTNHSPMYWNIQPAVPPGSDNASEYNDIGATNWAAHLNTLLNSLIP
jgi:hypothetical protein